MTRNLPNLKTQSILRKTTLMIAILFGVNMGIYAQAVSEIITDYEGFWKSGQTGLNQKKPVNRHNLLAFSFNGLRISTGVDDLLLGSKGETYFAADFRALPVKEITNAPTSNTKVGLGEMHDGVSNGSAANFADQSLAYYITDGKKGLDIGTGVANLPAGTIEFSIDSFSINAIGDGIPDILVTQIADPSGSTDKYEFLDANGQRVGNLVNINLANIAPVGNWTADFYEANVQPRKLTPGFTKTDRAIRLWAADFSDFGINAGNIAQVKTFRINLSGNSDLAFVAYNYNTMNINLPEQLKNFKAVSRSSMAEISWNMVDETGLKSFILESGKDGKNFLPLATIAAGSPNGKYSYQDRQSESGRRFYRLRLININGKSEYSEVINIEAAQKQNNISFFPNPASSKVTVKHNRTNKNMKIELVNSAGIPVYQQQALAGAQETTLTISGLKPGIYMLRYQDGINSSSAKLIVQ